MSNFSGGQYDHEGEIERQLQEEFRRRQAMQAGSSAAQQQQAQAMSALGRARSAEYPSHLGMVGAVDAAAAAAAASSPYYARGAHAGAAGTPYARMNPYHGAPPPPSEQAVAANYAANYGGPAPAYGLPPTSSSSASAQDIAIMQQAYKQQQENALRRGGHSVYSTVRSSPQIESATVAKPGGKQSLKGPALGKVTSPVIRKKDSAILKKDKEGKPIVEDRGSIWYMGSVPLGVDDDKYWLSDLQVYLRANFAEAFAATEEDIAAPMHGRNKPIALGQVGIRCLHCKKDNPAERGQQAVSYPSLISGIYNSVQQMLRLHLDCCLSMPNDVRAKIEQLKLSCSSRGGRKQYWIDSAKRLGLVDTPHGIHFARDPNGPLPPLTGPSVNSKENRKKKAPKVKKPPTPKPVEEEVPEVEKPPPPPVDSRPLVFPEDRQLVSDYLYLTLEQMAPCTLMESDRVGCYKTRKVGFPGLACKHCVGQAGCGRYFPASEASLSQTTTSQTIMNHVRNCRRCPVDIRENLELMKRNRMGPDGKRADKPKHGGRKVFFHRLWCRIQGLEITEDPEDLKEARGRKRKGKKKKRLSGSDVDTEDDDMDDNGSSSEGDTDTEDEDDMEEDSLHSSEKAKKRRSTSPRKKESPWYPGCVRLTKTDDTHWLSEMECFARSELIEVFSLEDPNKLEGYNGRKEPAKGQVGIRCVFCKGLDPSERPPGCVNFPESLSSFHTKVGDMIRLHFPSCPAMPDDARQTFKGLRGFDAKVASDDSQQYWVDSARDIGLANIPPGGSRSPGGWGVTFRRDPMEPSPADELDLEAAEKQTPDLGKNSLVRADDRGLCTDQVMLLLRQVRPCRFKKSDRRAGPGSRGRDRAMGFPGVCCMHCNGKNTLGRYFPVSAKNLTDSTANSLQAHVQSCARCPEPIKASLAYLSHRSILQKAELSGSWKKALFQQVWNRLHVERGWTAIDDEDNEDEYSSDEDGAAAMPDDDDVADSASKEDGREGASDGEKEEVGESMNALIKAAAMWLTEQDAATDTKGSRGNRAAKRPPPAAAAAASASAASSPGKAGRAAASLPTSKRRRVHF